MGDIFTIIKAPESEMSIVERSLTFIDFEAKRFSERPWTIEPNVLLFDVKSMNDTKKVYTGLIPILRNLLEEKDIKVKIENDRSLMYKKGPIFTPPEDYLKGVTLRDYQVQAIRSSIFHQRGILELPARSGKTEIAAALIKYYNRPALFVTHTKNIMEQTARNLKRRGLENVGEVSGDAFKPDKTTVAMVQTLSKRILDFDEATLSIMADAEVLFFDEVHHLKAPTWSLIGETCAAKHRFGLSATPFLYRKKEHNFGDTSLIGLTGNVIAKLSPKVLISKGHLASPKFYYIPCNSEKFSVPLEVEDNMEWHYVYENGIVNNDARNEIFLNVAESMYNAGMKVLLLVSRRAHGRHLLDLISRRVPKEDCLFTMGQGKVYKVTKYGERCDTWPFEFVRNFFNERGACIVIGTQIMDEGVDVPSLDAVLILSAMKSFRLTVQRATRSMTAEEGKRNAWIVDAFDRNHPYLESQSRKRIRTLKKEYPDSPVVMDENELFNAIEQERLIRS